MIRFSFETDSHDYYSTDTHTTKEKIRESLYIFFWTFTISQQTIGILLLLSYCCSQLSPLSPAFPDEFQYRKIELFLIELLLLLPFYSFTNKRIVVKLAFFLLFFVGHQKPSFSLQHQLIYSIQTGRQKKISQF